MAFKYEPHDWKPNELIMEAELDHIEQGIAEIANNLSEVAESGSYNDLTEKPTINGHELTGALTTESLDLGYTLPTASEDTLGGIKVGTRLNIDETGKLNVLDGGKADSVDWTNVEGKPENLSEFNNDQNFTTQEQVQSMINESGAGSEGGNFKIEVVDTIPQAQQMDASTIYMVPRTIPDNNDKYEEYVLVNDTEVERIGGAISESTGGNGVINSTKIIINARSLSWEADGELFKTTIEVASLNGAETNGFVLDVLQNDDAEQNKILRDNWNSIVRTTITGTQLTLYASKQFDNLDMQLIMFVPGNSSEGGDSSEPFSVKVVDILPEPSAAKENTIYLIAKSDEQENDKYEEYIFVKSTNTLEKLGSGTTNSGKETDNKIDLSSAEITLDFTTKTYDGLTFEPEILSVQLGEASLIENVDYVRITEGAIDSGTYEVKILGISKYYGVAKKSWSITELTGSYSFSPSNNIILRGINAKAEVIIYHKYMTPLKFKCSDTSTIVDYEITGNRVILTAKKVGSGSLQFWANNSNDDEWHSNYIDSGATINFQVIDNVYSHAYGVEWDGTSSKKLKRIDAAALFQDPVPSVRNTVCSSPFDNIAPWNGMKVSDINGNSMVSIPKFYYKFTDLGENGFRLHISSDPLPDFYVSPAHADRLDGKGERDIVYVGCYHCADDFKSKSGATPFICASNTELSTIRNGCKNLGLGWYMIDYPMWVTIQMLYLVEFANFDCQETIGYGCGNSSYEAMGYTSSLTTNHTGTIFSSRSTYGCGTRYRWIEGLWENCFDVIDGIESGKVSMDINNYNDNANNYLQIRPKNMHPNGIITQMYFPTEKGFEWAWFPADARSLYTNSYFTDYTDQLIGSITYVGGSWEFCKQDYGLFFMGSLEGFGSTSWYSSRPIYLP